VGRLGRVGRVGQVGRVGRVGVVGARTYGLNRGDGGLLASPRLNAAAASASHDGPSIAAHVDHRRYGLSLLNR